MGERGVNGTTVFILEIMRRSGTNFVHDLLWSASGYDGVAAHMGRLRAAGRLTTHPICAGGVPNVDATRHAAWRLAYYLS